MGGFLRKKGPSPANMRKKMRFRAGPGAPPPNRWVIRALTRNFFALFFCTDFGVFLAKFSKKGSFLSREHAKKWGSRQVPDFGPRKRSREHAKKGPKSVIFTKNRPFSGKIRGFWGFFSYFGPFPGFRAFSCASVSL